MIGKRWVYALSAILVLGVCGTAAWAYGHRSYAYAVDYTRISVISSSPYWSLGSSTAIQQWADARHGRTRITIAGLAEPIDHVLDGAQAYDRNVATRRLFAGSTMRSWLDWLTQQGCAGVADGGRRTARLDIGSGYTAIVGCARSRLAPGAVPVDFFAPPDRSQQLWDRLLAWLAAQSGQGSARSNPAGRPGP